DGLTALSGSEDDTLKFWDMATGKEFRTFMDHRGAVFGVALLPDGRTALSGSADDTIKLWDFSRPARERKLSALAAAAQEKLKTLRNDGPALAVAGEWFAFCGNDAQAIEH